ncbi:heterokaryon incompatibility protein-domain-containing protein [Fusarium flagelliforme]|uniref:heterokaryon incompatibility protein-domain-containing protein n=1 Tax=Fusarium flagelliforme TaxID=2675880 RepID=UPI001E8D3AB9|nr:heterokaryon incompatibility protein-domain-containing protein [Fusarium flagelliforme]KAH7183591.1 heterokaryon incompatibility protein-domain-containing protein [Fusarium flagelliforme]
MPYGRRLYGLETRLALIREGKWQDPISCSFEYESFEVENNANRSYSALSYVWGNSKAKETIQIDGHDHKISVNLACAIRHLRDERQLVLIWIDAICINQNDIDERSSQVSMMQDIYARALRVIVFLGDGSYFRIPQDYAKSPPPAPVTFSSSAQDGPLITHFHNNWEKLCRRPEWYSFCTICVLRLLEDVDGYRDTIECIANGKASSKLRLFELVRQFMNSQWWQRVWVVQETTVSSEVVIQYGNVSIPWTILAGSAHACENLGWGRHDLGFEDFMSIEREYAKVLPVFARQVFEIEGLRKEWKDQHGTGLLSLLQDFSGRKATDDRDKVFALLGLASDINTIEPDYSLSTVQVYRRTVLHLIKSSSSLSALSGDMKRKNSGGVPTWIPDWSVAIEEPDRRRMQVEATWNIRPRWRIELVDREQKYWELVARNMDKLKEEIEAGKRRRLPQDIVDGLSHYAKILNTRVYGTEWKDDEDIDILQQEAIRLCKAMYREFEQDRPKFWSSTPIRQFIDAHLSLPHIPSSGEWYRLDIVRLCAKIYCTRTLDLWFGKVQQIEKQEYNTNHIFSLLSETEKKDIIWDHNWYFHADDIIRNNWTWDEYARKTFPTLVQFIGDRLLAKESNVEEARRREFLISEATSSLERASIFTDSMTFSGASVDTEQLEILSGLIHLASEVLNVGTRSNTLLAVDLAKWACRGLISLHSNNFNESDDEYIDPFSTSIVFVGSATWMRWLRDNGPQKFDFDHEQFLESRRLKQHEALGESESILHISSTILATVSYCSKKLITWVDSASGIYTISQWALYALQSQRRDSMLPFAITLVGGLYEESPGGFRKIRRTDGTLVLQWFVNSLLPQLCNAEPTIKRLFRKFIADCRSEGNIGLDTEKSFVVEMRLATEGRVFFRTRKDGMGLGPGSMMPGDEVRILPGGNRPFVLRRKKLTDRSSEVEYEVIGDCYMLTDHWGNDQGRDDSLQGCLPVEILGGLLSKSFTSDDITLC